MQRKCESKTTTNLVAGSCKAKRTRVSFQLAYPQKVSVLLLVISATEPVTFR